MPVQGVHTQQLNLDISCIEVPHDLSCQIKPCINVHHQHFMMSIAPLAITDDEKLSKEQSVPISPSDTLVPSERDVEAGTAASVKRKQPLIRKGTFIDHLRKPESSFRRSWSWLVRRLTKTDSERTTSDIGDEQAEDEDLEDPWSCNITRSRTSLKCSVLATI